MVMLDDVVMYVDGRTAGGGGVNCIEGTLQKVENDVLLRWQAYMKTEAT